MADHRDLIAQLYSSFNSRNIDATLALMSEDVSWPKASEGGRVIGKEEIRAYWTRQWAQFDPHVEPVDVIDHEGGRTEVKVHQVVKDLNGTVISDQIVVHVFAITSSPTRDGLIERMDIQEGKPAFVSAPVS